MAIAITLLLFAVGGGDRAVLAGNEITSRGKRGNGGRMVGSKVGSEIEMENRNAEPEPEEREGTQLKQDERQPTHLLFNLIYYWCEVPSITLLRCDDSVQWLYDSFLVPITLFLP